MTNQIIYTHKELNFKINEYSKGYVLISFFGTNHECFGRNKSFSRLILLRKVQLFYKIDLEKEIKSINN